MKMGKKGYALVEAVTAVALVMMASGVSYRITCNNGNQRTLINP